MQDHLKTVICIKSQSLCELIVTAAVNKELLVCLILIS